MRRALHFMFAVVLAALLAPAFGQVAPDYSKTRSGKVATLLCASSAAVSVTGTASETILATCTIPAGATGTSGGLEIRTVWTTTNSANTKTPRVRLGGIGGTAFLTPAITTTASFSDVRRIRNRGAANSQIGSAGAATATAFGTSATAIVTAAVDMTVAQDLVITGLLGLSTETITLESYEVWLLP